MSDIRIDLPTGPALVYVSSDRPTPAWWLLDRTPGDMSRRERAIARALLTLALAQLDEADTSPSIQLYPQGVMPC